MDEGSIDLTPADIERLAAEVWDAAAKEALAKGLPVTGYHDGHLYRYHPDKRIEDLAAAGPAGDTGAPADVAVDPPLRDSVVPAAGDPDGVAREATELAADEFPGAAPQSTAATDHRASADATARPAHAPVTGAVADAAGPSLTDFTLQTVAFARHNAEATLAFTAKLFAAKTFAEVVELSTAHLNSQIEAFASHRGQPAPRAGACEPVAAPAQPAKRAVEPIKKSRKKAAQKARSAA